ncbi:helix-hairpin-helix domain-containing protein [Streptomyces sp. NPDC001380]|uniref:DNA polymerase Y family protein n=1 Tax=Streptomyces sp. NPDC001380 TaxID=3364566 RepID=UPI0036BDE82D
MTHPQRSTRPADAVTAPRRGGDTDTDTGGPGPGTGPGSRPGPAAAVPAPAAPAVSAPAVSAPAVSAAPPAADTGAHIVHVRLEDLPAAVEKRDRPDLADRPVAVLDGGPRGTVLSACPACPAARAAGVRPGMGAARVRRLLPDAALLPARPEHYAAAATAVTAVLHTTTPLVELLPGDRAVLDLTGALPYFGRTPAALARRIQDRIHAEHRLPSALGAAPNRLLARLAADTASPGTLRVLPDDPAALTAFLDPLPASALPGVGPATAAALARYGLHTLADLRRTPAATLRRALGPATGQRLAEQARGHDPRPVLRDTPARRLGDAHAFPADTLDPGVVRTALLDLAHRIAPRLRADRLLASAATLTVRLADGAALTRTRALPRPTDLAADLADAAHRVQDALALQRARIRHLHLRAEHLTEAARTPFQLTLDHEDDDRRRRAETTADRAAARYGPGTLRPASLLPRREG